MPTTHSSHLVPRRSHLIPRRTLTRSLGIVLLSAIVLFILSEVLSSYNDLQLANGAYYFAVLAGLTLLTGLSGQISLGHGALMAVGAYTVALLIGNEHWPALGALVAAASATAVVGVLVGAAATRLRGPYLAGVTLAFAVGLPALAGKYPSTFGGANGLVINPPLPPSWLGQSFPLERWEAWIACAGALVVLFVIYNLMHSAVGRALEAVRDDEIAASLCGLRVARLQTLAFVLSAACAGLAGGLLTLVLGLAAPGAFTLGLSLALLTGVVLGGLGSILGAIWGAALLVLLPIWSTDIAHSFSFSTNVTNNLPLAVYGLVLILAMLLWPSGLQGAIGVLSLRVSTLVKRHMSAGATAGGVGGGGADRDGGAGREQAAAAVPHRLGDARRRK